jgi:hypothetical protein
MLTKPKTQTYHATMLVTRVEEWCVEASSPEEAHTLLEAGEGHRCSLGEICCVEPVKYFQANKINSKYLRGLLGTRAIFPG